MSYTNRVSWETLRSRSAATFNNTYQTLGTALENPSYILKMVNNSDQLVTISIDGTTDIDVCPANGFWLYDEGKVGISSAFPALPASTQIYVKGAVAGTGSVYLVSQYVVQS
jgi:hypothetical protein